MTSPPKAVIFDYYETLAQLPHDGRERMMDGIAKAVGYESPPGQPWKEWTEQPSDLKLRFAGGSSTRSAVNGEPPPFRTFWDYWKERFEELFQSWDVDARGELGADAYTEHHIKAVVYPEVKDTLSILAETCDVAILSNADDAFLLGSLEKNSLDVSTVISSEELRSYKPHVSIFHDTCKRMGIKPEEALYVGDTPWADVEGSRNAGMGQVWINRYDVEWPDDIEPPQHTITSLADPVSLIGDV